jgi:Zn finger protein HypA/HybF involved in hydrogenase expression
MIDRIMDNRDSIFGDEKVQNYCMDCHNVSYLYGEREPDNPNYDSDGIADDESQVVCPKCESTYYYFATDEEIKKYGEG